MSLKATCWIKTEKTTQPYHRPPHQPITLLSCLCLLCFPEIEAASPLQQNHSDMASSQSSPGSQEPSLMAARMMPQQFLKVMPQFQLSTREGKKLEQVSRTSLFHALSSHIYPGISHGLSTVLHARSTHRLEGRSWLHCQAMVHSLRSKAVTYLAWKTSGLNSCKLPSL